MWKKSDIDRYNTHKNKLKKLAKQIFKAENDLDEYLDEVEQKEEAKGESRIHSEKR